MFNRFQIFIGKCMLILMKLTQPKFYEGGSNRQICPKRYDNDGLAWSENSLESQVGTIQLAQKNADNLFMRSYFSFYIHYIISFH